MSPEQVVQPSSLHEAVAALRGDARYLAGGQSLVQAIRLRLAAPAALVDLSHVAGLDGIALSATHLTVGAMARHADVAASAVVRQALPALAALAGGIGDPMVRSMGTLGGALANADPAACYPAAVLGLGATVCTDRREIDGDGFFTGLYETALQPGELITAVRFALPRRAAYAKHKQPASRFALVGVFVSEGPDGVRVAVTGAGPTVFRVPAFERALQRHFDPRALDALEHPADAVAGDIHAPAEYRAAMIKVVAQSAVERACSRNSRR